MQPEENQYGSWEVCMLDFDNLLEDDKVVYVVHFWKGESAQEYNDNVYNHPILTHHKWTKISDFITGYFNQNKIDADDYEISVHEYSSYEEAFSFTKEYSENLPRPVE